MKKRCSNCGKLKKLDDFTRDKRHWTGRHCQCKACSHKYARDYRDKDRAAYNARCRDRRKKNKTKVLRRERLRRKTTKFIEAEKAYKKKVKKLWPEKESARQKVRHAVLRGKIKKGPCEVCGIKNTHGHHDDYSKPLEVRWLCPQHHADVHRKAAEMKRRREGLSADRDKR